MDTENDGIRTYYYAERFIHASQQEKITLQFTRAILSNPTFAKPYSGLGKILLNQKKFEKAAIYFERAIYLDSKFPPPYSGLVECLVRLNRYEQALEVSQKLIESKPLFHKAYLMRGRLLYEMERYEEASMNFSGASHLNGNYFKTFFYWGKALEDSGKYDEAIEKFTRAMKLEPTDETAMIEYGTNLYHLQRYDEAMNKYKQVEESGYSNANLWFNKGLVYLQQGQGKEATQMFIKGVEEESRRNSITETKEILSRDINKLKEKLTKEGVSESFLNHTKGTICGMEEILELLQEKIKQAEA